MVATKGGPRKAKTPALWQFNLALKAAGMDRLAWCKAEGISQTHLYAVLSGSRESARLSARIAEFVREHAPAVAKIAA
jgi:hypothetical protein